MKDAIDPRDYRLYVTLAPDGTVAATHAFDATVENPGDQFVDVTDIGIADYSVVTIDPQLIADRVAAKDVLLQAQLTLAAARGKVVTATAKITDAIGAGVKKAVDAQATPIEPTP